MVKSSRRIRWTGIVIAIFFSAMAGTFICVRLLSASDGARLEPGEPAWHSDGVTVNVLMEQPDGLRSGDRVIAVMGERLPAWADKLFALDAPRPDWRMGDVVPYTVIRDGRRIQLQVRLIPYPLGAVLARSWSTLLFFFFTAVVLTVVFLLRPVEQAALVLLLLAWSNVHVLSWSLGLQVNDIVTPFTFFLYQLTASGAWIVFWSTLFYFALVFPQTHPILERRPVLPLIYGLPVLFFCVYLLVSRIVSGSSLQWMGGWIVGTWLVALSALVLTTFVFIQGYFRRWDSTARRKVRWLTFGFFLCGGVALVLWLGPGILLGRPLITASAFGLLLIPLPVVLVIAVWRDHLFDIDVIIRRTLTYSLLIALLAIVYFASVIVLQQIFALISNQRSELVTVLSTLVIAALFVPLRNRIQDGIDRRFYRTKYDAQKVLQAFSKTVRDETDLEKLTASLVDVVNETMQPKSVSVWLKRTSAERTKSMNLWK